MTNLKDWEPIRSGWQRFVKNNPDLGYSPSDHSYGRFIRQHYARLQELDAACRISGRYFVHKTEFANAAFQVLVEAE